MKICPRCNLEKDEVEFHKGASWCKLCKKEYDKGRDHAKYSESCKEWRQSEAGKRFMREWHQKNRERRLIAQKERAKENPDSERERQREWRHKNPDKQKARQKRWRDRNREKLRAAYKEWDKEHKDYRRSGKAKRRLRKNGNSHSPWTHQQVVERGDGFCPYCGKKIGLIYDSKIIHIDHIIPLSRGGIDAVENLEAICCKCNCRKTNKTREEFLVYLKEN